MDFTQYMLSSMQRILSRNREYFFKLSDQADRIVVWLVGFSIASIALSISNQKTLDEISEGVSSIIVIFSSVTIIVGILYRAFMYIAQTIENHLLISFEGYVEGYNNPPDISMPREISDNETIRNLVYYLKEDFNVEIPLIETEALSPAQLSKIQIDLTKYYNTLADINTKHLESQITEIKDVLKSNLGYSEKKADSIFNPVKTKIDLKKLYWFSLYLSAILFLATTLIFISGFVVFIIKYIASIICS